MKAMNSALLVVLLSILAWSLALSIACGDDDDDDADVDDDDNDDEVNDDTDDDSDDDADDDLNDDDDDDTDDDDTTSWEDRCLLFVDDMFDECNVPNLFDWSREEAKAQCTANTGSVYFPWDCVMGCWEILQDCFDWFDCIFEECGLVGPDDDADDDIDDDVDDDSDDDVDDDVDDDDDCEGCLIEETCYTEGEINPGNLCLVCLVASDPTGWTDNDGASCDDGLDCTQNICHGSLCVTTPLFDCSWPAESSLLATNLTGIEGPLVNDFHVDLSGAVWNPLERTLWVCRNNGPSKIWAVVEDGSGGFEIDYQGADRGEWSDFGDLEGLTLADLSEPKTLYLIVEGQERIKEYDLSTYGTATLVNDWNTSSHLPLNGGAGAEGITFVPDSFLEDNGFTDPNGDPYASTQGMDGLMFVGHQNGGNVYVFDLNRSDETFVFVGEYKSDRSESAGLEFDRSTGLMYIWHGASHNVLEVAGISSTDVGGMRKLDTIKIFTGPAPVPFGSTNYEGIALTSNDECPGGNRGFFLTIDGGGFHSLLLFEDFPCE